MRFVKPILLAAALAIGLPAMGGTTASASPVTGLTSAVETPQTMASGIAELQKVQYRRHRHGNRYRSRRGRHRHYYRGYWYAFPWWLHAGPVYSRNCNYWRRQCRQRWGGGRDYRGCMRHHGCRP